MRTEEENYLISDRRIGTENTSWEKFDGQWNGVKVENGIREGGGFVEREREGEIFSTSAASEDNS